MKQLFLFALLLRVFSVAAQNHHRIVIECDAHGTLTYSNILDHAKNLLKAFSPEPTQVEVVCHGDGINMLLPANSKFFPRMRALQKQGVVFAACANTMRGRHIAVSRLLPGAAVVPSGVAEVVREEEAGWSYIKGD